METLTTVEHVKCRRHLYGSWVKDTEHPYWHSHCTKEGCAETRLLSPTHPLCGDCKRPLGQDVTPLGESVELICMTPGCESEGQPKKHLGLRSEIDTPEKFGRAPTNAALFGNNLGSYGSRNNRIKIFRHVLKQPPFPDNDNPSQGQRVDLGKAGQRKRLAGDLRTLEKVVAESEEPNVNLKRMKQILSEHFRRFSIADDKDEFLHMIASHVGKHLRTADERLPRREIVDCLDAALQHFGIPLIHKIDDQENLEE